MRIHSDQSFLKIIAATPLVSVDLILKSPAGRALLGLRRNRPARGFWFVPGGRILKNETIAQAIKRVSKTELGISLATEDMQLMGAFDHIYGDNYFGAPDVNTHYVVLAFTACLPEDAQIAGDPQHTELRWWPRKALLESLDVHANTKRYF